MTSLDLNPLAAQSGIDLDKLKARYPALYKACVTQTGKTAGVVPVDWSRFKESSHKYLLSCAAPLPVTEPQIDLEAIEQEEQEDIQRRADAAGATRRLDQYATEQGLENTDANFALIKRFVAANTKSVYWSEQVVDLAIQTLRGQLTWKPKEVAPPAEPVEVLGKLPDGTMQLPLDTTPNKKHSTLQLKDWLARTNANRIIRPSGSFRSSF